MTRFRRQRLSGRPAPRLALFNAAAFLVIGVQLPFWPVWLAGHGLDPQQIAAVFAAAIWAKVVATPAIGALADRIGHRRAVMAGLAGIACLAYAALWPVRGLWPLLALNLVAGVAQSALLPLGDAVTLAAVRERGLDYGRIRVWGSLSFVLASIGTDGDIFPYLGMGTTLRARGYRATLLASDDYREKAQDLGLEFRPLASKEENRQLLSNPDFWHPIKGGMVGARWGAPLLPRHYALLAEFARQDDVTFVANPGLLAARVVQEKFGLPLATPLLQPGMIQSCTAPPALPAAPTLPRWAPRPLGHVYWGVLDAFGSFLLGRALADLRGPLGLPPVKRFFRWWLSPQLVLGMFPQWYAPPQPGNMPRKHSGSAIPAAAADTVR